MLSGARGENGRRKPSKMKWCSHCMKSINVDYVIGTDCTFWSCEDCGKILGQKQKLERARRTPKKASKETIVRTTESSSTESDGGDNIHLIGSVKKRRLKGDRRTIVRTTESSSMEGDAAD